MRFPKIVVGVVLFGTKYLRFSLPSLLAQDYAHVEFIFRDQSPDGAALEFIRRELPEVANDARVTLTRGENLFHSGGHNTLIREALKRKASFYFCASNDMFYESNLVSELVHGMRALPLDSLGAVTGKLLRWDYSTLEISGELEKSKTKFIDTLGLGLTRAHHFYDLDQGLEDRAQISEPQEIFGASGALALYSLKALHDVACEAEGEPEFFDELMHYKNDVDLAYRLRWAGYRSFVVPTAIAYHARQVPNQGFFANRRAQTRFIKESSFLGQRILLYKNFSPRFSLFTRLATHARSFALRIFALTFEPFLWRQFAQFRKILPELRRKQAQQKIRATPSEIEIWMK